MNAILMSIRPKWVAKILNGEKTIEIRKKFPKDYVGWVYIYCTKDKKYANLINRGGFLTGMVVARFWCDKVEEIKFDDKDIQRQACLTEDELFDYLFINEPYHEDMHKGYGISITKLEIFDKPMFLYNFYQYSHKKKDGYAMGEEIVNEYYKPLTRAPQNYCYVEI